MFVPLTNKVLLDNSHHLRLNTWSNSSNVIKLNDNLDAYLYSLPEVQFVRPLNETIVTRLQNCHPS